MNGYNLVDIIDRISFSKLFLYWVGIIVFFGVIYAIGSDIFLNEHSVNVFEGVYFSFSTVGVGGSASYEPVGMGKVLTIIETILGLSLYGIALSKIVSYKQEVIIQEVYEISFQEKITRLRSMLNLFRSDINAEIEKMEEGKIKPSGIKESAVYFHTFATTMEEINELLHERNEGHQYVKRVDFGTFELLLNSIIVSLDKAIEFFTTAKKKCVILTKVHYALPVTTVCSISSRIVKTYRDLDYTKIKNKLVVLETLTNKLREETELVTKELDKE